MSLLFIFGTRPEAIKLAPLIRRFKNAFEIKVCITSQHMEMLKQVLDFFKIPVDYDLKIMEKKQTLSQVTCKVIQGIEWVLSESKPELIFVQGDTTSAFAATLSCFYHKIPVAHIEAGLRSFNKFAPYPEEINRVLISHLADYHFCPTKGARENLLREGMEKERIFVVGNTVVDALLEALKIIEHNQLEDKYQKEFNFIDFSKKLLLVTAHRRENFGKPLRQICLALKKLALTFAEEIEIIYPVHLNPQVEETVKTILKDIPHIHLLPPVSYPVLVWFMKKSYFILTDSGGIQEEAPILGKPILVLRKETERPEGIKAGIAKLIGTDENLIFREASLLISDKSVYKKMARVSYIYGDGNASERIFNIIKRDFYKI
ncbi:non-hydrolyzing UDP-N-acetylglucosamine 2-epimerase [Desulfonauticus submarinus]